MPVNVDLYVKSMRNRWIEGLGNAPNKALEAAWADMADTFNRHIEGKAKRWSVLQLPTGTGKTQGLAVYCQELARLPKHPGVLVITRFTEEADKLVELINRLAGAGNAVARHSKIQVGETAIQQSPVLIVTHAAYLLAMEEIGGLTEEAQRWRRLVTWQNGERRLTIIDEALNTIEQTSVGIDEARMLQGLIPYAVEKKHAAEVKALRALTEKFERLIEEQKGQQKELFEKFWRGLRDTDFMPLANAMSRVNLSATVLGREANVSRAELSKALQKRTRETFANLTRLLLSSWNLYAAQGVLHTLNTAYLPLPPVLKVQLFWMLQLPAAMCMNF
jgi:hypothetical protein